MQDDLYLEQLECGPMQNFVYVVGSRATREVLLVDPAWAIDALLEHLAQRDLTPVGALVTHYHPDHIGGEIFGQRIEGLPTLLERRGLKIYVHRQEADGVRRVTGVSETDLVRVDSEDTLRVGDVEIEFLHTPGHTPGSQCFRVRRALVSGDTLFVRGCGRVDLPGANPDDMFRSLQRLSELPDDVVLYPGHNYADMPNSTLGDEKRANPYLRIPTLETWRELMGVPG
jgi:glyoxylase-like metal-dependent hydrolase (beta-lactamase superfamily II)